MQLESFEKVIIWGHKLYTHTHSYIYNGFYIAFKHLGHQTYWFDDSNDVADFDFSNSLFLTEDQADKNIPLRQDCQYMLHNCTSNKYYAINVKNRMYFQVYTDAVLSLRDLVKIDTCIYCDLASRCLYMPWATDLLPHEIDEIKNSVVLSSTGKVVYWIGTIDGGEFGNCLKERLSIILTLIDFFMTLK